jgi:hypothetical protein
VLLPEKAIRLAQGSVKVRRFSVVIDVISQDDETSERPLPKFSYELLCQVVLRQPTVSGVAKHHKGLGGMHGPPGVRR